MGTLEKLYDFLLKLWVVHDISHSIFDLLDRLGGWDPSLQKTQAKTRWKTCLSLKTVCWKPMWKAKTMGTNYKVSTNCQQLFWCYCMNLNTYSIYMVFANLICKTILQEDYTDYTPGPSKVGFTTSKNSRHGPMQRVEQLNHFSQSMHERNSKESTIRTVMLKCGTATATPCAGWTFLIVMWWSRTRNRFFPVGGKCPAFIRESGNFHSNFILFGWRQSWFLVVSLCSEFMLS